MGTGNEITRAIKRLLVTASRSEDDAACAAAWQAAIALDNTDNGADSDVMGESHLPPFRLRPYICYANLLRERGEARTALTILEPIRERWQDDPDLHMLLGCCYGDLGEWHQAVTAYRRANELRPRAMICILLGGAYDKLGRHDDALQELWQALAIDPSYEEAHYNLGCVLRKRDDLDGAIDRFRRAIAIDPDYQVAHADLGSLLLGRALRAGWLEPDRREPLLHLTRAVTLDPDDGWSHARLAVALERDEARLDDAETHHRAAVRHLPDVGVMWSGLGTFLANRGELIEAESVLRRAVEIEPDEPQSHAALGRLLWRRGKRADARSELRAAHRLGYERALTILEELEAEAD